jgi:hypothetical protein
MKRYYFNIYNDDITLDDEGALLADAHAARAHAVKSVRSLAAETVLLGHFVGNHRIEFVDSDQNIIGEVRFDEAVVVTA